LGRDYLKNCKKTLRERIKIAAGSLQQSIATCSRSEFPAKNLSSEQSKNSKEKKEKDQKGDDGLHAVDQRGQEVLKRPPIPNERKKGERKKKERVKIRVFEDTFGETNTI
jgi:hypothetical protein